MGYHRQGQPAENAVEKAVNTPVGNAETPIEIIPEEPEKPAAKKLSEAQKKKRRRIRALTSLLLRILALALVIYILFFHIVGLTTMPGMDMSPRVNVGDLLLFYRVERNLKSQDIVVIDKAVNEDNSAIETEDGGNDSEGTGLDRIQGPGQAGDQTVCLPDHCGAGGYCGDHGRARAESQRKYADRKQHPAGNTSI